VEEEAPCASPFTPNEGKGFTEQGKALHQGGVTATTTDHDRILRRKARINESVH
jgi:hypothetical protein